MRIYVSAVHLLGLPISWACLRLMTPCLTCPLLITLWAHHHSSDRALSTLSLSLSVLELASIKEVNRGASGILFAFNIERSNVNKTKFLTANNSQKDGVESKSDKQHGSFNWRLAANPRSLILWLAIVVYCSGVAVTYQCLLSLGKASGKYMFV